LIQQVCSNISAKEILFITTLDSQKAFDVVNHQILMDKLYHLGINLVFWDVIADLYQGLTSTVKWLAGSQNNFLCIIANWATEILRLLLAQIKKQ
jgi:hypothetical protein